MRKQLTAVFLILVIGALTLSIEMQGTLAQGPTGECPPRNSNPNTQPWFCACWHDNLNWLHADTMAGIGATATYDMNNNEAMFNEYHWYFDEQAGFSWYEFDNYPYVEMVGPMVYIPVLDYGESTQTYTNCYDYSTPVWGVPPGSNHWTYYRHQDFGYVGGNDIHSIEGETIGEFCWNGDPWHSWSIYVYTCQPNPQDPLTFDPYSFNFLTAHYPP